MPDRIGFVKAHTPLKNKICYSIKSVCAEQKQGYMYYGVNYKKGLRYRIVK